MNDAVKKFLEATKLKNMGPTPYKKGKDAPPLETPCEGDRIALPEAKSLEIPDISLRKAITDRRSVRKYDDKPLSVEELSYALWATQGVHKQTSGVTLRSVPSAGARHAFDTFLLINNVEGLKPGLYRYMALEHALVPISLGEDYGVRLKEACLGQKMVENAAVTFVWAANIYRMYYRYGERGYRYIFLDAGHVSQNLYLVAEQLQCGTVAIAAYDDDAVNALLGLDGTERFSVYIGTLGKR